jgi:hypothetical protein
MRLIIWVVLCAFACGGPDVAGSERARAAARTCGPDDFIYTDVTCGPLPGSACYDRGDGLCHLRCASDADCPDQVPFCRTLGLYRTGDYNCNDWVPICREADLNDCPFAAGRR